MESSELVLPGGGGAILGLLLCKPGPPRVRRCRVQGEHSGGGGTGQNQLLTRERGGTNAPTNSRSSCPSLWSSG